MEKKLISSHLFELLNLGLFKHAEHIGAALHRLLLHLLWCLMADIKKCNLKYHDYPFDLSSLLLFWLPFTWSVKWHLQVNFLLMWKLQFHIQTFTVQTATLAASLQISLAAKLAVVSSAVIRGFFCSLDQLFLVDWWCHLREINTDWKRFLFEVGKVI